MSISEIYSYPVLHKFKAPAFSKAAILNVLIGLLTYILPLFLSYRSYGFWLKSDTFVEQPTVHFKHQFVLFGDIQTNLGPIHCSTFTHIKGQYLDSKSRCPVIKSYEKDYNHDGKNDEITFELEILLDDSEDIHGVTLLLLFDYKLKALCSVHMEGMTVIQYNHPQPGVELFAIGDLQLNQKTALGKRTSPGELFEELASNTHETFQMPKIYENYARKNASVSLNNINYVWSTGRAADETFKLKVKILVPPQKLEYTPGFWQVIKWAWLQYLAILVIVKGLTDNLKFYVFTNFLVPVIKMPLPWTKKL